jgi:dolichol-phosphate mannosyltransferase
MTRISILTPVYNEGAGVRRAYAEIRRVLRAEMPDTEVEIIFIDDGSRDDSFLHLTAIAREDDSVKVIRFAGNRGSHMALRAGLRYATGDCAAYVPCDLQEPPSLIPRMAELAQGDTQVVWALRQNRRDPPLIKLFSRLFYFLAVRLVSRELPQGIGTFLIRRTAIDALNQFAERNLAIDGALSALGLVSTSMVYERQQRLSGRSEWTLNKKLKHFADFFVAHSYVPIRLMSYTGMLVAALGFLYAGLIIFNRFFYAQRITGWTSLMVAVLVLGGLQMIMIGVIGEYLWRTLDESRGRPRYIIDEALNIPDLEEAESLSSLARAASAIHSVGSR